MFNIVTALGPNAILAAGRGIVTGVFGRRSGCPKDTAGRGSGRNSI